MRLLPIINQQDLFLDINLQPLIYGRVDLLDPVSTNPLNVYTYTDEEYVISTNPIRLDIEGRAEHTFFTDRLTYCRVYAYKGKDEYDQDIFEFVRDYYVGEDENSESREYVTGMEALKDLDPSINSSVNVIGYYNDHDCEMRQYYWDPNSTLDPDGGYVVKSDVSDSGRWILKFDGEYLPSTYYGVYPGSEANVNALMSYVGIINGKATAPGVYFIPGNYSFATNLSTNKKILLDCDTRFACNSILCNSVNVIGNPTHAIVDFYFDNPEQVAHSSWFKTVTAFFNCGASTLEFDVNNNFTNSTISTTINVNNTNIIGHTRLPVTYANNNSVVVYNNCNFLGEDIFTAADQLRFINTVFMDKWFQFPGNIDFNTKVTLNTFSGNVISLSNFTNTTAYINAIGANGGTRLDLEGRYVGTISVPASVTTIENASCNSFVCTRVGANINIRNLHAASAVITCSQLVCDDSVISFASEPNAVSAAWFNNCRIEGAPFQSDRIYVFRDCEIETSFFRVTDNVARDGYLEFTDCFIDSTRMIESKNLVMKGCTTNNAIIRIYPYQDNGVYKMYAFLQGNNFNSGNPVELTKMADDECYEVIVDWTIVGNSFTGNETGIRCRYWSNRTGSNYDKTFIKFGDDNKVVYKGNTGNCPLDNLQGLHVTSQGAERTITLAGHTYYYYTYAYNMVRCMTNLKLIGQIVPANPTYDSFVIGTNVIDSSNISRSNARIFYWDKDQPVEDGDLFRVSIAGYNKLTANYWEVAYR